MSKLTLAQVAYLSQELTDHYKVVKRLSFKAFLEMEMAQKTLNDLLNDYGQWRIEEGFDFEHE